MTVPRKKLCAEDGNETNGMDGNHGSRSPFPPPFFFRIVDGGGRLRRRFRESVCTVTSSCGLVLSSYEFFFLLLDPTFLFFPCLLARLCPARSSGHRRDCYGFPRPPFYELFILFSLFPLPPFFLSFPSTLASHLRAGSSVWDRNSYMTDMG